MKPRETTPASPQINADNRNAKRQTTLKITDDDKTGANAPQPKFIRPFVPDVKIKKADVVLKIGTQKQSINGVAENPTPVHTALLQYNRTSVEINRTSTDQSFSNLRGQLDSLKSIDDYASNERVGEGSPLQQKRFLDNNNAIGVAEANLLKVENAEKSKKKSLVIQKNAVLIKQRKQHSSTILKL